MARGSSGRWAALPWLAGLAGLLIFHRYTIFSGFDSVQADLGDSRFVAMVLEHWNAAWHGKAALGSPLIFYPVQGTLAYSVALAVMGAVHVVLRALGMGVFTAMNVQEVLLTAASYAGCYLLLRRGFGNGRVGATAGAFLFAFSWPRFAQLVHVQLQFTATLPLLALLALECLRDGDRLSRPRFAWRGLAGATLFLATLATEVYLSVFALLILSLAVVASLVSRAARQHYARLLARQWPGLLAAALWSALLLVPIMRLYGPVMRQSGGWSWAQVLAAMPKPVDFVWMGRENFAWGWLFDRWPGLSVAAWADDRMGFGLVLSLAWLASLAWAAATVGRSDRDRNARIAALAILAGGAAELLAIRVGAWSPWWLIYKFFPGAGAVRGVGRIVLAAALPMAIGLAQLLDRLLRSPRPRWRPVAVAMALLLATFEQMGDVQRYSGREAEAASQRIADAIPKSCRAALVVASPGTIPVPPPVEREADFNARAYLRANPDVAANWKGSAWSHYVQFGRAEHRGFDPDLAERVRMAGLYYAYTIVLAAELAGIPVVNGWSGWRPPGWNLDDPLDPDLPKRLPDWLHRFGIDPASVCVVPVKLDAHAITYRSLNDPWWTDWSR